MYRVKHRIPPREMSQKERQLLTAVEKGHTKMVETLISQGVSVNCKARVSTFSNHNVISLTLQLLRIDRRFVIALSVK